MIMKGVPLTSDAKLASHDLIMIQNAELELRYIIIVIPNSYNIMNIYHFLPA